MVVEELSAEQYAAVIKQPLHVFNTVAFNLINRTKVSSLHFLLFIDTKPRLGIITGIAENELRTPFSAPFGGFSYVKEEVNLVQIEAAVHRLITWAIAKDLKGVKIGLPPTMYSPSFISKIINVLYRIGFVLDNINLNYAFKLSNYDDDYAQNLRKNARKNLKNALANDLQFRVCQKIDEQNMAYNIIANNRKSKGYPLRMTWEQVEETKRIVKADFFLVYHHKRPIAAAIVFHVSATIVQVIYWGDLPDYSHLRPMNFLAYKLFGYYKEQKLHFVDIGPSTENSQPNYGLCDFKESIGCDVQTKTSWSYHLA